MKPATGYRVEGAARLRRTLRSAGDDLSDMRDSAHRPAAAYVAQKAASSAPVKTGRLSAAGRPGATKTGAMVRWGGARVPYAGPIHYGWPRRNIRAQPFITDTVRSNQPQIEQLYNAAVEQILNRIKGA